MALTRGFASTAKRRDHFDRHRAKLGVSTEEEYEARADAFLGSPLTFPVEEMHTEAGDLVRYNDRTDEFGVLSREGYIRSYFKIGRGREAGRAYFRSKR